MGLISAKDLTSEERKQLAEKLGVTEEALLNDERFDPNNYSEDDQVRARLGGSLALSKMLTNLLWRKKSKERQ